VSEQHAASIPRFLPGIVLIMVLVVVIIALMRLAPRSRRNGSTPPGVPHDLVGEEVILRTYWASKPIDAITWFQRDLDNLVEHGYVPATQSWAQGEWGVGSFLIALVLTPFGIGVVIFLFLVVVRPVGTLTATFVLRGSGIPAGSTLPARLVQLDDARRAGLITDAELAAKREAMLRDL